MKMLAILLPVGLILKEPNLGTAVITGTIGAAILLAAGVRWWKFVIVIVALGSALPIAYNHLHDYQRQRIITFMSTRQSHAHRREYASAGNQMRRSANFYCLFARRHSLGPIIEQ